MAGRYTPLTHSNDAEEHNEETVARLDLALTRGIAAAERRVRILSQYKDCGNRLKTFREVLKEQNISDKDIKVLITGRVGMGKSTLINSILEDRSAKHERDVAKEGSTGDQVTTEVKQFAYRTPEDGNTITLIDSPGLRHFSDRNNKHFYDNLFEDMMIEGEKTNAIFYCRKMTDQRFGEDELTSIRQLYHTFGPHFWESVVIVLTFANVDTYDEKLSDDDDELSDDDDDEKVKEIIKKRFTKALQERSQELKNILTVQIPMPADVVDQIRFVPAGYYKVKMSCREPMCLPDRPNWLKELLIQSCHDKEGKVLSSMSLRENLHLAIIIDDEGLVEPEDSSTAKEDKVPMFKLNKPAQTLKEALQKQGQLVLAFNSLSTPAISRLLNTITTSIKSPELAAFSLFVLSKVSNCEEIYVNLEMAFKPLLKVPKIFFTHIHSSSKATPKLPILPSNSIGFTAKSPLTLMVVEILIETIEASYMTPVTNCFKVMKTNLNEKPNVTALYNDKFGQNRSVFPPIYAPSASKRRLDFNKKKLDIQRVIWRKIRSQTCHYLFDNKDELRKILRNERIARIATGVAGVVIGGGLVIGGIAAAPFTFGASIGLAVAGGAVGIASGMGGIGAMIARKIMANARLKEAQEQITLDQQVSMGVNANVLEYYEAVDSHIAELAGVGSGVAGSLAAGGRIGMAAAIGAEGALEGGALALRTTGRVAGMALAGISLAVTVPIDLAFIAYHSYRIHQAKDDKSGANENDSFVTWFIEQIKGLLLDTITIHKSDCNDDGEIDISGFGLHIQRAPPEVTYNIRTLFSGPFKLPPGVTIVSAVYDVSISKGIHHQPIEIDLNHCVDINNDDRSFGRKMSFAVGKLDYVNRSYTFELLKGGTFVNKVGFMSVEESCQICVVYTEAARRETNNPVTYAALCCYDRKHKNCWNLMIMFIKHLDTHLQFTKREFPLHANDLKMHRFKFLPSYTGIRLEKFRNMSIQENGWVIAPANDMPENQIEISRKELNFIEILEKLSDSPVDKIPCINLTVQVTDEQKAVDEFTHMLHFEGTDLVLPIERKKEVRLPLH